MKPITIIGGILCLFAALSTQASARPSSTTANTTTADRFNRSITTVLAPTTPRLESFEPTTFTSTITTNMAGTLEYQSNQVTLSRH